MEEGKVYSMRGGQIKIANKWFTKIPNDYCLSFDNYAQIEEVHGGKDEIRGASYNYNFITLNQTQEASQVYMIDLIAFVSEVQLVGSIQIKATG